MNIKTIVVCRGGHRVIRSMALLAVMLMGGISLHAQEEQGGVAISPEARAYFRSMSSARDTAEMSLINKWHKDSFKKRLSFHTNMVDWLLLVPNFSVEADLKQTTRTNWSVMLTGKFNGGHAGKASSKRGYLYDDEKQEYVEKEYIDRSHDKFRFDVAGVRVEARHYWRTGKFGKKSYHDSYVKLNTNITDTIGYNADSLSSSFYNRYQKIRRNVFSGRTIDNPRYWRAYYVGPWAAYDLWNLAINNKGKSGKGIGIGVTAGWSIPLLPQRYPKEGSLDLDLGAYIGIKAVRYKSWEYNDALAKMIVDGDIVDGQLEPKPRWSVAPYPIIQDIHVGLVWRFRGIKSKVDRSLIDDYEKKIEAYKNRMDFNKHQRDSLVERNAYLKDSTDRRNAFLADSTQYWDKYNGRRLENALRLDSDTVFTGDDYKLYLKIIKGIEPTEENMKKIAAEEAKAAKAAAAEKKKADEQAAAEQRKAEAAERKAAKKAAKKAKDEEGTTDELAGDLTAEGQAADSTGVSLGEQITDSTGVVLDKKAAKKAAAEAKKKAKKEAKKKSMEAEDEVEDAVTEQLEEAEEPSKETAEDVKAAKKAAAEAKKKAAEEKKAAAEAKKKAAEEAKAAKKAAAEAKKDAEAEAKAAKKLAKEHANMNDENSEN